MQKNSSITNLSPERPTIGMPPAKEARLSMRWSLQNALPNNWFATFTDIWEFEVIEFFFWSLSSPYSPVYYNQTRTVRRNTGTSAFRYCDIDEVLWTQVAFGFVEGQVSRRQRLLI